MFSNVAITKAIENSEMSISPFHMSQLGPCSYDVALGSSIRRIQRKSKILDLCHFDYEYSTPEESSRFVLNPGECVLAVTQEFITLGAEIAAQVHSKSSLGRMFQSAHAGGAGFVDAGFHGRITLELVNLLNRPVAYHAGMMIAQLSFYRLDIAANPVYDVREGQYSNDLAAPIPAKPVKFGGSSER